MVCSALQVRSNEPNFQALCFMILQALSCIEGRNQHISNIDERKDISVLVRELRQMVDSFGMGNILQYFHNLILKNNDSK